MTRFPSARPVLAGLLLAWASGAPAANAFQAPGATGRSDAAEIGTLRQALASGESATAVLDRWCSWHGLAPAGSVRAEKLAPDSFPIPAAAGAKLRRHGRAVVQRRVRLHCGGTLLSEARLWFAPDLLTPEMRRQLAETDRPFGAVVAAMHFRRVQSRIASLAGPPGDLFSVEAYLVLPDGQPLAFTREVYKAGLLKRVPPPGAGRDAAGTPAIPRPPDR